MNVSCYFCGEPVDPTARDTYRRVVGWERKGMSETRKGGSDIVLRAPMDELAHGRCVLLVRHGVSVEQGTLL